MMMRLVLAPTAPSHDSENGACPPVWRHGWKWSLIHTESSPAFSARTAYSSSSLGANCSADALNPNFKKYPLTVACHTDGSQCSHFGEPVTAARALVQS